MTFVILAFAVARLTRLVTTDDITEPIRNWILRRWPAEDTEFGDSEVLGGKIKATGVEVYKYDGAWYAMFPHRWSQLVSCAWCAGVWVGIIVWAAYSFYPVTEVLLTPFALAHVAGLLHDR